METPEKKQKATKTVSTKHFHTASFDEMIRKWNFSQMYYIKQQYLIPFSS